MSPRRSSRASRSIQPAVSGPQQNNATSSSSSSASGRASRSAGPEQRPSSRRSSVAARSQSSEDPDRATKTQARRTRSSQEDAKARLTNGDVQDVEDEGDEEDEDVTRCICRNQEYPGPPISNFESTKSSVKGNSDSTAFSEDTTGWFIQCDDCKVWQHGGCVGIMDEAISPEEYYCEQCRKDLHKISATSNGRIYSLYLPAQDKDSSHSSPAPAPKKHTKRTKDNKEAQSNADNIAKGRRSTMNSRDAAYEEEQLRLAIEESKREGRTESTVAGTRRGKRSRSESEEAHSENRDIKRQRTTSGSGTSASHSKDHLQNGKSEDEIVKPEKLKNIRGAAARNHKNKEAREREAQREKERADAGRRTGHSAPDNGSGSVSPDPPVRTASSRSKQPPIIAFPPPDLPNRLPLKQSHKKTGRPPARKGRVGRNQYTKDRDLHTQTAHTKSSPAPSNSSQNAGTPQANGSLNGDVESAGGVGKPSRPRHMNPNRTTMNDMKRRVAGILQFISHTQVEMAGSAIAATSKSSPSTNTPPDSSSSSRNGQNGKRDVSDKAVNAALLDLDGIDEQAFAALNSIDMMEVLTRRLMRWQGEYGKWGDK